MKLGGCSSPSLSACAVIWRCWWKLVLVHLHFSTYSGVCKLHAFLWRKSFLWVWKRLKFQTMNSKECIERYAVLNVHFHREIASVTKFYHVIVGPSQKSSAFASVFARNNLTWPRSFPKMYKPFHFEIGKVLLHLLYFYQQIHFATCNLF